MKKVISFCVLILLPLVGQAGYVFEVGESGMPISDTLKVNKETIEYVAAVEDDKFLVTVRHEYVDEKVLKELSDNYGAKVRISSNEEYGIGKLEKDDLVFISDRNINIANTEINTTGSIHIRSNLQVTLVSSYIYCGGDFMLKDKDDKDNNCLSFYSYGSDLMAQGDITVEVSGDVGIYNIIFRNKDETGEINLNKSANQTELHSDEL